MGLPRGLGTLFVSHVMFSIPFVAVTVRARAANLDRRLEDAAMDLGANQLVTFFKVTLPLIFPGILAGWLLAFALSMDDFVITQFVSGTATMFPTWVFGATKVGIPPHVFVFATFIFLGGVLLAGVQALVSRRRPA
jgi:spermidine/putrescine transport system permease protein